MPGCTPLQHSPKNCNPKYVNPLLLVAFAQLHAKLWKGVVTKRNICIGKTTSREEIKQQDGEEI